MSNRESLRKSNPRENNICTSQAGLDQQIRSVGLGLGPDVVFLGPLYHGGGDQLFSFTSDEEMMSLRHQ